MHKIISVSKKTRSLIKKASFLRLAKQINWEFTNVNDQFICKRNEKNGVFLQRLIIYLTFLSCFIGTSAFGQVSLEECQTKARENFPLIKQFDLIQKSKEYTISNANRAYLPQLDLTVIGGVMDGLPSFSLPGTESSSSADLNVISIVQVNQVIWDGGITKANKNVINASAEIENADLEVSLFALEERVNNLYFGILLIDEQLQQIETLKSTLQRNKKRAEVAVKNGAAYKSDIDEIQVELLNTDQKMEELLANRQVYVKMLALMVGDTISADTEFSKPIVEENIFGVENNRPELQLFQSQEKLIEAQKAINKSMLYPKIGLMGFGTFIQPGVDFGTSELNNILVGGLSLSWNIGGLYRNGNNKQIADINMQKVAIQRETFLFNNRLELNQTELELQKYKALIDRDKEILALKTRIKEAYNVKYENGVCTMSALLDQTNQESIAQQNLIVHEIQYLMKIYQYKNKTGN